MVQESARGTALKILERCEAAGSYANLALDAALRRSSFAPADKALTTALVYGTIERRVTLDAILTFLSDRPLDELDPTVLTILRMGLYQLRYLDRIPEHAAVNESVALCSKRSAGYVNAILRAYLRAKDTLPTPDAARDPIGALSFETSIPRALCERFTEAYGAARAASILCAFDRPAPLTLRTNTLRTTREKLIERLRAAGHDAEPTPLATTGVLLPGTSPRDLPGFDEGLFFVQDEASQLCVEALDARSGQSVIDVCACPGSKSFGAAMAMQNNGRVLSCDLHANKLSLVASGAAALGLSILATEERDGREPCPDYFGHFDRVLCDVPCSGFGVLAKKPEIRHKDPASAADLPDIQLAILENASNYLAPGGRLVYSTCTLLPEENAGNISRFLVKHPDFALRPVKAGNLDVSDGYLTLTPDVHGTDGFFIAVLERAPTGAGKE